MRMALSRSIAGPGHRWWVSAVLALSVLGAWSGGGPSGAPRIAAAPSSSQRPRIAAAANLNFALTAIAEQFARDHGTPVDLVFGASGTLTRQIQEGAPFELFLSADEAFPRRLTSAGLTRDAGAVYAIGRLVLFAPRGSALTVDEGLIGLGRLLKSGGVTRFAIANPAVAPYGKAAEAVLRKHGLWDAIRPQLVLGDTISQTAQFTTTGNAVGGLLAYSIVSSPEIAERGAFALIPAGDHPPMRQRMVLLKRAGPVAMQFYEYIRGRAARAVLGKYGYEVP